MPLILSDLHLGLGPLETRQLAPLVEAADQLWLNGDTAEERHPAHRDRAQRLMAELQDACSRRGIPLVRLAGNHDHHDALPLHRTLADGRIFVTHGHAFLPEIAPWSVWSRDAGRRHREFLASLPPSERDTLDAALGAAAAASEAAWVGVASERKLHAAAMLARPWAVAEVLRTWWRWPGLTARFVETHWPQARVVVSGHSHRRACSVLAGRTLMNTGSFHPPARPAAVLVRDQEACWIPLSLRRDVYALPPESRWRRVRV